MRKIFILSITLLLILVIAATARQQPQYIDKPFWQDYAEKFFIDKSQNLHPVTAVSDRNGVIKVLSREKVLHPWDGKLVDDLSYRPINDMNVINMVIHKSQFMYLTDKAVLSNAWAGKFYVQHNLPDARLFAFSKDFPFMIASDSKLVLQKGNKKVWSKNLPGEKIVQIACDSLHQQFVILTQKNLYTFSPHKKENKFEKRITGRDFTSFTLAKNNAEIIVGTKNGYFSVDAASFSQRTPLMQKVPWPEITCVKEIRGDLWFGSTKGAFKLRKDGKYDYYASYRWLAGDDVISIEPGPDNSVLILSNEGLSRIHFKLMTLADKAAHYQKIQRLRHIRYGFNSEVILKTPGDLSSYTLIDTDNDGLWTSMYLAGELFRYAVTKSNDALQNAYEAFEAMERLDSINPLPGFPSRSFEYNGYNIADLDKDASDGGSIWRLTPDGRWRWKSTTSSDESDGHFFVYALFAEIAPDKAWRKRAINEIDRQASYIVNNNFYLIDWDGKPTRWGRWNPDYVNSFPIQVGDRKLNSQLILSFMQIAYHFTGKEIYKTKAFELIDKYGYFENAIRPMSVIGTVEGNFLTDGWNHSDDEMYFLNYFGLSKYAFTEKMKQKYNEIIKDHWQYERPEKKALYNFIYAALTGAEKFDLKESIWTLQNFPMDLIAWNVKNSMRQDIEKIPSNFRGQTTKEVLPPDERPLHLHNSNEFTLDGGEGGRREYPGYIYLLPYWLGRYAGIIVPEDN
ncbi:MAG: hypothetical protein GWP06_12415 [Actinobacteria bacterium]|nr:hypothetical protein [Actinomycetota bacterium]